MATSAPKFTHKGWFGLCPIYIADLESGEPTLVERHRVFFPLFLLSEFVFGAIFAVQTALDPYYEPEWPIRITGELER